MSRVVISARSCLLLAVLGCQQQGAAPPTVQSGGKTLAAGAGPSSSSAGARVDGGSASSGPILAGGIFAPTAIALGPDDVYWTAANGLGIADASAGVGGIASVPRSGGPIVGVIGGISNPGQLAIYSSTTLFFGQSEGGPQLDSYVLGATVVNELATAPSSTFPITLYPSTSTVYWSTGSGTHFELQSTPATGGDVSVLFDTAAAYEPQAIGVLGSTAYILASTSAGAFILSAPTSGGAPSVLWKEAAAQPVSLAASGASLYWTLASSTEGGEVLAISTGGGEVFTLASNIANVGGVAVLDDTVYFTSNVADGAVLSVGVGGGAVSTLASGIAYPSPLAVDDAVYVGTSDSIIKVPLP